jgi:hypothetical protein
MSKSELDVEENKSGGSRAGEGAFSPTPNELARLKEELESELQLRLSLKKYYNAERFCDIIEDIIRKVIKKHFNLNEKDIYVEYLDIIPNSHRLIERGESPEGQIILLEDIKSTDRIIAQFNINNQSYELWILISYESRELQIGDIYMMRLLRPIYVEDIKIRDERMSTEKLNSTHNETTQIQIKKIRIDLSELYRFDPRAPAHKTLENILQNYRDVEVIALVNISPDVGLEVRKDTYGIAEKIFKEEEDDLVAEEKVARELAKRLQKNITVIELLDGYEAAIAFAEPRE